MDYGYPYMGDMREMMGEGKRDLLWLLSSGRKTSYENRPRLPEIWFARAVFWRNPVSDEGRNVDACDVSSTLPLYGFRSGCKWIFLLFGGGVRAVVANKERGSEDPL